MKTIIRTTELIVLPEKESIFCERGIRVSIDDDGAGSFIVLKSQMDAGGEVKIDDDEWPALRDAIESMVKEIKKHEPHTP